MFMNMFVKKCSYVTGGRELEYRLSVTFSVKTFLLVIGFTLNECAIYGDVSNYCIIFYYIICFVYSCRDSVSRKHALLWQYPTDAHRYRIHPEHLLDDRFRVHGPL